MGERLILSIDAMGGDKAPEVVIDGMALFAKDMKHVDFLVHGDEAVLRDLLAQHGVLKGRYEIVHTQSVILNDMKASQALRRGKGSSMWNAVEAVKSGAAAASVSAGNTGALMAISMLLLRKMDGVKRPGMTALWPTVTGRAVILDVGANLEATGRQLLKFAIMGEAFARAALEIERPRIGILNVGSEDMKGHEEVRRAHELLQNCGLDIDYRGFVEGDDISAGAVDVVVTDGFTGNIAIKAGEGVAHMAGTFIRDALTATPWAKFGALLAASGLKRMKSRMDPARVNGGVLLGLNGVSVKSHGGTSAEGFATACRLAEHLVQSQYDDEIHANLAKIESGTLAQTQSQQS